MPRVPSRGELMEYVSAVMKNYPRSISVLALYTVYRILLLLQSWRAYQRRQLVKKLAASRGLRACVVGAGLSGIAFGEQLEKRGIPYVVFEKAHEAGGTWLFNNYPLSGCDIPGFAYSFSFALTSTWTRAYCYRDELLAYFLGAARKAGMYEHIIFNQEVISCEFKNKSKKWFITRRDLISKKEIIEEFDFLFLGLGQLNCPKIANIPSKETFSGAQFHTARWNREVDLTGKKVIGIGTGSSALQAYPGIADRVKELYIMQRSPTYVSYRPINFRHVNDYLPPMPWFKYLYFITLLDIGQLTLYAKKPLKNDDPESEFTRGAWVLRAKLLHDLRDQIDVNFERYQELNKEIPDTKEERNKFAHKKKVLLDKLTPKILPGCKRIGFSDEWYPMMLKNNVHLVDDSILRIEPKGVVIKNKNKIEQLIEGDVIVWATGFEATSFVNSVNVSVEGKHELHRVWGGSPQAYKGMMVPDFPNMFIAYGPNSNLGHNPITWMIECQARYSTQLVEQVILKDRKTVDVKRHVFDTFNKEIKDRMSNLVFTGKCGSWYKNSEGENVTNWVGTCWEFSLRTLSPNPQNFNFE